MQKEEIRLESEKQFLAILATNNDLIDFVQIKPKYLKFENHKIILESMIECYKKDKIFNVIKAMEYNRNFPLMYFTELFNTQLIDSNYKKQFFVLETEIFNFYKEDIIFSLNEKLRSGQIDYSKFMSKINELNDIQINKNTTEITKDEILNNISKDKVLININNFKKLNNVLELVQGDFLVVGATTGMGKSGLLLNFMNGLMDKYQCIYFNMEMSKSTIYKRMISIRSDIPIKYINEPSEYQKKLIEKTIKEIEENKVVVEHNATDISSIKSLIKKVKSPDKHTIIFIDHLGLTKCEDKKSLYEQATEVSKQLRQICLTYDCTVIAASQLNRSAYNSEEITLSMLKDSGELENSASKVILLYRDKDFNKDNPTIPMYLDVAKNRDGQVGVIKADYDRPKQIFKEKGD